jgi:putative transposase
VYPCTPDRVPNPVRGTGVQKGEKSKDKIKFRTTQHMKQKKKHTDPLLPDTYYHIYNRGINGTRIFTKRENSNYFLEKYIYYISPIADTFAYVLMGNHFHFLIKTKSEAEILAFYLQKFEDTPDSISFIPDRVQNPVRDSDKSTSYIISKQFSNLFNTYAQAINRQENRTGGLFETPFRRIPIDSEDYAAHLVFYIHNNPVKHGFAKDFQDYPYSSYHIFTEKQDTFLQTDTVLTWFGGKDPFLIYHGQKHDFDEKWYEKNWVEVE